MPNAVPVCAAGACAVGQCQPGFADCNGDPADGCEALLAESNTHCGSCGNACTGGTVCQNGSCVASCTPPTTSCFGTCANLVDSPRHCGGCTNYCDPGNYQTAACANGACLYTAIPCPPGQTFCNGTGCVDLTSDAMNCGACGASCAVFNDIASPAVMCVNGTCAGSSAPPPCGACAAAEACVDGACVASQTLATGLVVDDMAVDGTSIYFVSTSAGTVNVVPAAGGAPTALASGQAKPLHLAVDTQYVYYSANLGGAVMRVPKAGGAPTAVVAASQPTAVLVDGQNVYWQDNNGISAAPKAGGPTTVLVSSSSLPLLALALAQNSQSIIYGYYQNLWQVAKTGIGGPQIVAGSPSSSYGWGTYVADDTYVYVNAPNGSLPNSNFHLRAIPLLGVSAPSFHVWLGAFGPMVVDQSSLYGVSGGIYKLGLCQNAAVQALPSLPGVVLLALDSTYVYWSDGTSIGRVPK